MSRVPELDRFRKEIEYCTYCPKLCRFACPVANAERRETATPWGRQTMLHLVQSGAAALDAETTDLMYRCLSCLRCREFCDHEIEIPAVMRAARAAARDRGQEPEAVTRMRDSFMSHGNEAGEDLGARVRELVPSRFVAEGARAALFLGCSTITDAPETVENMLGVIEAAGIDWVAVHAGVDQCCGLPQYEAGAVDDFVEHARRLLMQLGEYRLVITPCPACAYTLRALYREHDLPHAIDVLHLTEFLGRYAGAFDLDPGGEDTIYFEPCYLGRYLGNYEVPRRLLTAALGRKPLEYFRNRKEAYCCGGGSLVRLVAPDTARGVAEEPVREAREQGARVIATACPRCRTQLREAAGGEDLEVLDVVEVLDSRLKRG